MSDDSTVADLSALKRFWTQEQYLTLTNYCHRLIEFTDGCIEVLPMPTQRHQRILRFLFLALVTIVRDGGGDVFFAPCACGFATASVARRIFCSSVTRETRAAGTSIGSAPTWSWKW